ncbi:2OG-Fe dioxygenase family protein [Xenorhabdus bovienii]|uniref:2OG-Fe dioxygenase family protein n=1 Tax=Xenorhabdus bovienii TaxID=40576 RepID=UPI003DA585C3
MWLPTKKSDKGELSGYDQENNNPEYNNIRYFNSISSELKNTKLLQDTLIDDFNKTFFLKEHNLPIYAGVHIVKIICSDNSKPGFSSPDCFHQDGEPFTFAHLVKRSPNVLGGDNYIANVASRNKKLEEINSSDIISKFKLQNFLEIFAVCDEKVSHYVSHLTLKEKTGESYRRMILIDFSFTKQSIE